MTRSRLIGRISKLGRAEITLATSQATTSGSTKDFTGIPAGTKTITVMLNEVGTDGIVALQILLGDAGGFETTGYRASAADVAGTIVTSSAAFLLVDAAVAGDRVSGSAILSLMNATNNTWMMQSVLVAEATPEVYVGAGSKSLTAELTQLRFSCGGDAFDEGSVNIQYQ